MMRCTAKKLFFILFFVCLVTSWAHADYVDDFKKRARSIYLLHSVKFTARTKNVREAADKRKTKSHILAENAHLGMLSYIPSQSIFLPFDDIQTIVSRIEMLTKQIEITKEGETAQRMKFDMAYEYFLLYLHYLNEKYGLTRSSELSMFDDIPVTDKELEQYLALSEYYLKSFLSEPSQTEEVFVQGKDLFKITDDVSFPFRDNKNVYINVYFLAMMLESEKLSANWSDISMSGEQSIQYDKKTWNWLNNLWKRHFRASPGTGAYTPEPKTLFNLYELYLRYHFFGRYIRGLSDDNDPLLDAQTQTLFNRLYTLQKEARLPQITFYKHYLDEAKKDLNNTSFLVNLYLARRGFFAAQDLNFSIPKYELFELYHKLYDTAASQIKYNIPYRSIIYNELILYGIGIDNLRLMEDVLYEYGLLSMRLQESEDGSDNKIKNSSRLTMAYLLANILDKKRRSGLDQNSDEYRDIAETLTPILITKGTEYWEYASVIHSALAMFYSRKEGAYNESLAMYHAKRAFMAPCEKVALTFGKEGSGWAKFHQLPGAESYLKLFLEFQKKYQTSPDAVMPREFNSNLIIKNYQSGIKK